MPRTATKTIGFRLTFEQQQQLDAASVREGLSSHELARRLVSAGLTESAGSASLHAEVLRLRGDISVMAEAILIAMGMSSQDVSKFITEKFRP